MWTKWAVQQSDINNIFKANNFFKKEYGFENQFLHASELHFGHLAKPLDYLSSKSFKADMPEEYNKIIDKLKEEK